MLILLVKLFFILIITKDKCIALREGYIDFKIQGKLYLEYDNNYIKIVFNTLIYLTLIGVIICL